MVDHQHAQLNLASLGIYGPLELSLDDTRVSNIHDNHDQKHEKGIKDIEPELVA